MPNELLLLLLFLSHTQKIVLLLVLFKVPSKRQTVVSGEMDPESMTENVLK